MVLENVIHQSVRAQDAIAQLKKLLPDHQATLFVVDYDNRLIGSLTEGNLVQGLAEGKNLQSSIEGFLNKDFLFLHADKYESGRIPDWKTGRQCLIPVLDSDGRITRIIDTQKLKALLPLEPIMMAGGKGSRLLPLTREIPKPLLTVGGQSLLEHNLDRLISFGMDRFHLSVHYLAHKVSNLLGDGSHKGIEVSYVMEDKPLGTIGALGLIDHFEKDHLLVMNADLLTNLDFEAFYQDFLAKDSDMAVATRYHSISLPFGVLELDGEAEVSGIREKPTYTYPLNAGIYILKKELVDLVPEHQPFDAPDLIQAALKAGYKVRSFPILDYWLDIGNPEDYERAQRDIKYLNL